MLSDWAEILCQESHHPESKTFICFYSIDDNYFVSLNWAELYSKQMQVKLPHPFPPHSFFFFFLYLFIWLHWVFVAGLSRSPVVMNGGYSLVAVSGFLTEVASFVMEHAL